MHDMHISETFLFVAKWYSIVCLSIHRKVNTSGFSKIFPILNLATVNIITEDILCTHDIISPEQVLKNENIRLEGRYVFTCIRTMAKNFIQQLYPFIALPTALQPHQHLSKFSHYGGSKGHFVVILTYSSLVTKDAEHLFMCLFSTYLFSLQG